MQNNKCQQHKLPILFACLDPNCKQTREMCAKCAGNHSCLASDSKDVEKQEQEGCVQVNEQFSKENEKKSIKKLSNDFWAKLPSDIDDDFLLQIDDSSEELIDMQNKQARIIKKKEINKKEGGEEGDESCLITAMTHKNVRHNSNGSNCNNINKGMNINNNLELFENKKNNKKLKPIAMKMAASNKQFSQKKISNDNLGMINKAFPISSQNGSLNRNNSKMQLSQQIKEDQAEEKQEQTQTNTTTAATQSTEGMIQEEGTLKLSWNNNKKQQLQREIPKISRSSYKIQNDYNKRTFAGNLDGMMIETATDLGSQNQTKGTGIQGILLDPTSTLNQLSQSKTNRSSNNINKLSQNSQQKTLFDYEDANNHAILSQKLIQNQQIIGSQQTGKSKEDQNAKYLTSFTQSNQIERESQGKSQKDHEQILKKVPVFKNQNLEVPKSIKVTKDAMDTQIDESWFPKWCENLKLAKEIINQSAEIKAVRIILANLESIKNTLVTTVEEAKMNFLASIGMEKQDLGEQDFHGNDFEEEIMNQEVEGQGFSMNSQNKGSQAQSFNTNINRKNQEQILSQSKGQDYTNSKSISTDGLNAHENYLVEQYYKREGIKLCNRLNKKVSHNRVSEYLLRVKAVSEFLSTHSIKHIKQSSLCAKLCQLQRELAKILKVKIRTTSKSAAKHDLQEIIQQQANVFGYGGNPQMPAMFAQLQQQKQQQLILSQFLEKACSFNNPLLDGKQVTIKKYEQEEEITFDDDGKKHQTNQPQAENSNENSNENDSYDELLSSESPSPEHQTKQENHIAEKPEPNILNKLSSKMIAPSNTPATGATTDFYSLLNDSHHDAQKNFSILDQSFLSLNNFNNINTNNFSFSSMLANQSIDSANHQVLTNVPSSSHPQQSRDPHIILPPQPNQAILTCTSTLNDLLKEPTCQQIYNQYLELTTQQFEEAKESISDLPQIIIEFDGICQKQCSASAFVLKDSQSEEILLEYALDVHVTTANQAEYLGLIFALRTAKLLDVHSIKIASDSDVIVKHLTGIYQLRTAQLKPFFLLAKAMLSDFSKVEYHVIHKAENQHAEQLAKSALILENV